MEEPIFLTPQFKDRIWGGQRLSTQFNYVIPNATTGECWGISAHKNGVCEITNGVFKGQTLDFLWKNHRELFGNEESEQFPLLVKILDANDDLSVQVHPDDIYARNYENGEQGKTECWYILDCEEGAEIVFGHHAQSKEEFIELVNSNSWDKLLRRVKVKSGDFFYVPSGTIHAIGKGIVILETQQSSDVTYRVYDYDRIDSSGNTRELHLEQSIKVTKIPHEDPKIDIKVNVFDGLVQKQLISERYFSVYHWSLNGKFSGKTEKKYLLISVLDGDGVVDIKNQLYTIKKGDHFILPATISDFILVGNASLMVSHT